MSWSWAGRSSQSPVGQLVKIASTDRDANVVGRFIGSSHTDEGEVSFFLEVDEIFLCVDFSVSPWKREPRLTVVTLSLLRVDGTRIEVDDFVVEGARSRLSWEAVSCP